MEEYRDNIQDPSEALEQEPKLKSVSSAQSEKSVVQTKGYPEYKDSGVEWIGEVPRHWFVKRIKWFSNVKRGASPRPIDDPIYFDDNGEYSWVRIADVSASKRYLTRTTQTLSELGSSLSVKREPGDFFLSIAGTVGKPIITKIKCCIHDGFVWFPDLKINAEFLYYIFETGLPYLGLGKLGTQLNLNTETVGNISIPFPGEAELEILVNYLDHRTTQIDDLIRKKERLIQLLEEERTAIINQAVTKGLPPEERLKAGLDPDVTMKDSGIEWLGKIPEHWEVSKVKHFTEKVGSGITPRGGAEVYKKSGIPLLRSQNIYSDHLKLDNVAFITTEIHKSMKNSRAVRGDVLLNITGGSIGRCFYLSNEFEEANVNQHVCILRPNDKILTRYLHFLLSSDMGQIQIYLCQLGGNREALNFEQLKNFSFSVPPIEEQERIIEYVDMTKSNIERSIGNTLKEIQLLKEYKTALISEVVTGKIDVRDEVLD